MVLSSRLVVSHMSMKVNPSMRYLRYFATLFAITIGALGLRPANSEEIIALTSSMQLLRFDSATPEATMAPVTVSGLAAGDMIMGIDIRPSTGVLYGFSVNSGTGKVYAIHPVTGVATLSANLSPDPSDLTAPFPYTMAAGSFYGVDFNPVADRLRVTTDSGQNLRINVTSGLTQLDVDLTYAGSDPNAGSAPQVIASAYTNNFPGAATTTLYNLDASLSNLVTQLPPNNGILNSVSLLGLAAFADSSFDISGISGTAFAVLDSLTLSTINLTNGEVTAIGPINAPASIVGIAAAVPEPAGPLVGATTLAVGIALRCIKRQRRV